MEDFVTTAAMHVNVQMGLWEPIAKLRWQPKLPHFARRLRAKMGGFAFWMQRKILGAHVQMTTMERGVNIDGEVGEGYSSSSSSSSSWVSSGESS